jgi:hypothetical protein
MAETYYSCGTPNKIAMFNARPIDLGLRRGKGTLQANNGPAAGTSVVS